MEAVEFFQHCGNVRKTARRYSVQQSQILKWRENYSKIKKHAKESPLKLILHSGTTLESLIWKSHFMIEWLKIGLGSILF